MRIFTRILNFILLLTLILGIIKGLQIIWPDAALIVIGSFAIGWWSADLLPMMNALSDKICGLLPKEDKDSRED